MTTHADECRDGVQPTTHCAGVGPCIEHGPPVIEVSGVSFGYDSTPVLEDVNLTIARGDFACLIGSNGGGKTTLLRLLLGLLTPARGTIRILGQSPTAARRRIGYMPQRAELDPQFPVTARDVALMGRLGRGWGLGPYSASDRTAAMEALRTVGLADRANSPFCDLSGGQRQRVLIARALACAPEILMLDEPSANLDPRIQDDLYELLRELNDRLTILTVSHDVGFVHKYVKNAICVNRQVTVHHCSGEPADFMKTVYGHDVQVVHHHHDHTHPHTHTH